MLTDESRAALAAMSEGCREALLRLAETPPTERNLRPAYIAHIEGVGLCSIPADPTAIVAEAARTLECPDWTIHPIDGGFRCRIPTGAWLAGEGADPLTAALLLFTAAYERAHGGGDG